MRRQTGRFLDGVVVIVVCLAVLAVGCCQRGGSGAVSEVTGPVGAPATVLARGSTVVLPGPVSGLDSVRAQVRVTGVPADYTGNVTLEGAGGDQITLVFSPSLSGDSTLAQGGKIWACRGFDLRTLSPVSRLAFSEPLPGGAVVQVCDAGQPVPGGEGTMGSAIRRKILAERFSAELSGDGVIDANDIALLLAWSQIQGQPGVGLPALATRTREILPTFAGQINLLPTVAEEDLNGDGKVDSLDVAVAIAWVQTGRRPNTALIASRAAELVAGSVGTVTRLPGTRRSAGLASAALEIPLLPGKVSMKMALIPPGTFLNGGIVNELYGGYGTHTVTLTRSYYMSMTEVTQAQFLAVSGGLPPQPNGWYGPDLPVLLDKKDAMAFCNALSDKFGLRRCYSSVASDQYGLPAWDRTANGFRLPSEAEWQWARLGGMNATNTIVPLPSDAEAWTVRNSGGRPHPVGLLAPNGFGLYDMSGNANEYCYEWFFAYAKYGSATFDTVGGWIDPVGAELILFGTIPLTVGRGGSFHHEPQDVRLHTYLTATEWQDGLRVVRNAQ